MKKILILFLAAFSILSCQKEPQEVNPYVGTTWTRGWHSSFSGEDVMDVLSFTDTEFSYYEADLAGNYRGGMTRGEYTYIGNRIFINFVKNNMSILDELITGATVDGDMITLHIHYIDEGEIFYDDRVLMRKR